MLSQRIGGICVTRLPWLYPFAGLIGGNTYKNKVKIKVFREVKLKRYFGYNIIKGKM